MMVFVKSVESRLTGRLVRTGLVVCTGLLTFALAPTPSFAQWTAMERGSDNIDVLGHLPLGGPLNVGDMDVEPEVARPFAYVGRMRYGTPGPTGMDIISIADPERPTLLYEWRIENQDLHTGLGGMDVKTFKLDGRYYVVQSFQYGQGGPDFDLGAVVFDVTGLPDPSTVREVARIREPLLPGGFHNIFIYKHSDGRALLFTTVNGPSAHIYDLGRVVRGATAEEALVGRVPIPEAGGEASPIGGYHDFYVGYHPDTDEDRFYGGGAGGYFIYDVTNPGKPELRITLTGIPGVPFGHTFTPSPDGRYVIAETEYEFAPLRIFDLQPALDGETTNINRPIAGWTSDYRYVAHNHEVRWPLVFVSGYLDGLQIFNMQDPTHPMTVGYYDTYIGPREMLNPDGVMGDYATSLFNGAFGVDVRNEDGLILISDFSTGLWTLRMDGFQGWSGEQWGMPNVSSEQQWDEPVRRPISQ